MFHPKDLKQEYNIWKRMMAIDINALACSLFKKLILNNKLYDSLFLAFAFSCWAIEIRPKMLPQD